MALGVSLTVLAVSLGLYGLYLHYNGRITRLPGVVSAGGHDRVAAQAGVENFLLVGSDDRTGLTPAQLAEAHTTPNGGGINTDVLIIVHIDPRKQKVDMISIPRDTYVAVPGWFNDPPYNTSPDRQKINAIYVLTRVHDNITDPKLAASAGAAKLVQTVQTYSGLHIDHYVQVNFGGFLDITKAIGGVTVCLSDNAFDPLNTGIDLSAGTHTLTPEQALQFVRQRHGNLDEQPEPDLARIQRQQAFFGAVLRKAESPSTFLNPVKLNNVLNAVTSSISADAGLTLSDLKDLSDRLKNLDPAHLSFFTVPIAGNSPDINNAYLVPALNLWPAFFAQFADEATPSPSASSSGPVAGGTTSPTTSPSVTPSATPPINAQAVNGTNAATQGCVP